MILKINLKPKSFLYHVSVDFYMDFFTLDSLYELQFDDIGAHGTKVIIYNLWMNDEGVYELTFDDDDEVRRYNYSVPFEFLAIF